MFYSCYNNNTKNKNKSNILIISNIAQMSYLDAFFIALVIIRKKALIALMLWFYEEFCFKSAIQFFSYKKVGYSRFDNFGKVFSYNWSERHDNSFDNQLISNGML